LIPPHDDTYRQKPRAGPDGTDYTIEKEIRYVLTSTVDPDNPIGDYLCLSLPDCSDICELTS